MSTEVTTSEFRNEQSRYLDVAQREPVSILSRGALRRAIEALEDMEDIRAAAAARREGGEMTLKELKAEFGLD